MTGKKKIKRTYLSSSDKHRQPKRFFFYCPSPPLYWERKCGINTPFLASLLQFEHKDFVLIFLVFLFSGRRQQMGCLYKKHLILSNRLPLCERRSRDEWSREDQRTVDSTSLIIIFILFLPWLVLSQLISF